MSWPYEPTSVGWGLFSFDLLLRLWFGSRILHRRLPASVAWAWLSVVVFVPLFGTLLYLFFGEYRQSGRRQRRLKAAQKIINRALEKTSEKVKAETTLELGEDLQLSRAFQSLVGWPATSGNDIRLLRNANESFPQLITEIDQAKHFIDLEFYIWSDGGRTNEFAEALLRAVQRGVRCRLLVDAIGSAQFIRGKVYKKLREGGVHVVVALPSGFWRSLIARPDLRIHRKIIVIDGAVGFTGSMNLADPVYFKKEANVGPWVDALARIEGPAVQGLSDVFLSDWCAETGDEFLIASAATPCTDTARDCKAVIQCLPSGPALKNSAIEQALIMSLNAAHSEITLTTPYFIPSEALLYSLMAAARRGIRTTLIVPKLVDSRLTHYASRSFYQELVDVGVVVALYRPGLLHTKSVTIDKKFCLFGSLNLDSRSLRINYEITCAVYDWEFTQAVFDLQESYLRESDLFTHKDVENQSWKEVWATDVARLLGPLL